MKQQFKSLLHHPALTRCLGVVALSYAAILLLLMALEDKLIFFPIRFPDGYDAVEKWRAQEGPTAPALEDCFFTTSDGVRLHGWYAHAGPGEHRKASTPDAEIVLLWFHGNAGNISHRYDMMVRLLTLPVDIFIFDYRGYGKSEGRPSEEGLYLDAQAAWEFLVRQRQLAPRRIVLFGKSLGSAVAIDLAARVQPGGLIVQSGFTSIPDMASAVLPIVPRFLIRTRMDSLAKIGSIQCPKLFIHSPADEVVPYRLGLRLYEAAGIPKAFYEVAGAPHNETYLIGGRAYLEQLRAFLQDCRPG